MKRVALAFALAFLPLAASAQRETIEVDGKETLSGPQPGRQMADTFSPVCCRRQKDSIPAV